jgi:hypothetical protein
MSRTLTIPDALYTRLERVGRTRGFRSIEQFLEVWQSHEDTLLHRQEVVTRIDGLRKRLFATARGLWRPAPLPLVTQVLR